CASLALMIGGCATTASYRPEIDTMKGALAEAKAAGAETLAPEEYAHAEACLDWLTHEATEFRPFADPNTSKYVGKCRPALQALKSKMAAAREAKVPAPPAPVSPVPPAPLAEPAPAVDEGIYPTMGTLEEALAALPRAEEPPVLAEEPPPLPPVAVPPPAEEPPPAAAVSPPPVAVPAPAVAAPPAPVTAVREPDKARKPPLEDIFFDFDMAVIRPDARKSLDGDAQWLRANPKATFIIEGHCDERGTHEYNLALGQRRAKATQDYLAASGIDPNRSKVISYGRERPFVIGHDEEAWKWNRRAHFVLE
ncbi:MAG: peptidoglycan-associated lipoprotein Pal, partial [Candidatus Methylomirabilis sp.]